MCVTIWSTVDKSKFWNLSNATMSLLSPSPCTMLMLPSSCHVCGTLMLEHRHTTAHTGTQKFHCVDCLPPTPLAQLNAQAQYVLGCLIIRLIGCSIRRPQFGFHTFISFLLSFSLSCPNRLQMPFFRSLAIWVSSEWFNLTDSDSSKILFTQGLHGWPCWPSQKIKSPTSRLPSHPAFPEGKAWEARSGRCWAPFP